MLLYLAASFTGVALLVGFCFVLFGRASPRVGNSTEITARLADEIPGFCAGDCVVDTGGRTALIEDRRDKSIYLVEALGDGVVTRALSRTALRAIERTGETLTLRLVDFTLPRATLKLASNTIARDWQERLFP